MMTVELDQQLNEKKCLDPNDDRGEMKARWAVVLSGGEGASSWRRSTGTSGDRRPKQYCKIAADRTSFEETIGRAASMVPSDQVVTVIGRNHQKYLAGLGPNPVPGTIIEQPFNLGTATAMLLPTTFIAEINPEATLVFLPSDHFVHPEELFLQHVVQAFQLVDAYPDRLILIGVPAERPETHYGWVVPQPAQDAPSSGFDVPPLLRIRDFREKPGFDEAVKLMSEDALWSTMVVVVKVRTIWALARRCLPETMAAFDTFRAALNAVRAGAAEPRSERFALSDLYEKLKPADFSKDVLAHAREETSVMPMLDVAWCDWGPSGHLTDTLARLGRTANSRANTQTVGIGA